MREELFLSNAFLDPRDLLQVKYEMLRRVREDDLPVSQAAANFGVSRPTWYQAQSAYEAGGLPGLLPDRPGPHRPYKLGDEEVKALQAAKSEQAVPGGEIMPRRGGAVGLSEADRRTSFRMVWRCVSPASRSWDRAAERTSCVVGRGC